MTPPAPETPTPGPLTAGAGGARLLRAVRTEGGGGAPAAETATPPAPPHPAPPHPAPPHPDVARTEELVDRLRRQWLRSGADIASRLRAGASDADLDHVQEELGLLVPVGARTWWRQVDGVDPVRTRYRASAPTVGPGGWVPLGLDDALRRATGQGPGPGAPPGLLPMFARDEELIAVRLGASTSQVEQLVLGDDGEGYQHGWRLSLDLLLSTWAGALLGAVHWLPDVHDWVVDPFAVQALANAHLLD